MRVRTLLGYLIGREQAILDIAADPSAAPIGFLFVLSAGLAREYDGADLVHEPWQALLPIPASVATSFLLFCLTYGLPALRSNLNKTEFPRPSFWTAYRMFVGLFWLTAPLAWLYAVPYERFLDPADATRANLYTLGLVAVWRVLLMCRVVIVLMGYAAWEAVAIVFLLGDIEALLAVLLSPVPIIELMGGIRYTESERLLKTTAGNLFFLGGCSLPLWFVLGLLAVRKVRPCWRVIHLVKPALKRPGVVGKIAIFSVLAWLFVLPFTQPEQVLRRKVERLMAAGQNEAALDEMSAHEANAFPPHWEPPPRLIWAGEQGPVKLLEVIEIIAEQPPAPWVRALYVSKFARSVFSPFYSEDEARRVLRLLDVLPEGASIKEELEHDPHYYGGLRWLLEQEKEKGPNGKKSEASDPKEAKGQVRQREESTPARGSAWVSSSPLPASVASAEVAWHQRFARGGADRSW
jgi:hypothetical protein